MTSSRLAVFGVLLVVSMAPLGCEPSSTGAGADSGMPTNPATDAGTVDPPVKSECVAPTKGPTEHGSPNADETWTADASPHILRFDTTIYKTITLEPCAEVLIAAGKQITVRGKLVAEGTASKRVHIGGKDAGKPYASIRTLGGTVSLSYTTVDGGGLPLATTPDLAGTIDLQGEDASKPTQEILFVDHVTVDGSVSNGIVLKDGAGFAEGSTSLVVKGSAVHPVSLWARASGGLPPGTYTGNAEDSILFPTAVSNENFHEDTTLHDRGVPYLVGHPLAGGDLRVEAVPGGPPITLTIEPGVTMKFKKGGVFQIAKASSLTPSRASLIAAGTADKPIVFTSAAAEGAPGDWLGIRFGDIPSPTNKVDLVRVEWAGGTSSTGSGSCIDNEELMNDSAIRFTGLPSTQFITNTTISGSKTNGIDRGYRSDVVVDFVSSNTFIDVALCNQTYPGPTSTSCPEPVPCPK